MAETFNIQLIESCKKGNRVAQKVLYDSLASRMFPVCIRYVGDRALAEDILQEGFIRDLINCNDRVVLVVLKKSQRMDRVSEMIRSEVALEPILIIDDEGDEATLNGKVNR